MKLFIASSLFIAAAVAQDACGIVVPGISTLPNDARVIAEQIVKINTTTVDLNQTINAFQDSAQAAGVLAESGTLLSTIKSATSTVAGVPPFNSVNENDSLDLASFVSSLACSVNYTVENLIHKKALLVSACQGPAALLQLKGQQTAATAFADTTLGKIPAALSGLAGDLTQPILDSLAQGVASFSDQTSLPSSCSSSTSSSTSTSTPGASPTASSTTTPSVTASTGPTSASTLPTGSSAATSQTTCRESIVTAPTTAAYPTGSAGATSQTPCPESSGSPYTTSGGGYFTTGSGSGSSYSAGGSSYYTTGGNEMSSQSGGSSYYTTGGNEISSQPGGSSGAPTSGVSMAYSASASSPTWNSQITTLATPVSSGPAVVATAAGDHIFANGYGAFVAAIAVAAMF